MSEHKIRLCGPRMEGTRISAELLTELLSVLIDGAKAALRLRVEGRSTARGTDPSWLIAAAGFDFVGLSQGSTVIEIDAPPVSEAAPDKFGQQNLFLKFDKSAIGLFEEALAEAVAGNLDSDLFDEPLLAICQRLNQIFYSGVETMEMNGDFGTFKIEKSGIEKIATLRKKIPSPHVDRLSGKFNTIRHTDRGFEIVLSSGAVIRGVAPDLNHADMTKFFGKEVVVTGMVFFHPSGSVQRIEATNVDMFDGSTELWSKMPRPREQKLDVRRVEPQRRTTADFVSLFGKWPGCETDEQIREALK